MSCSHESLTIWARPISLLGSALLSTTRSVALIEWYQRDTSDNCVCTSLLLSSSFSLCIMALAPFGPLQATWRQFSRTTRTLLPICYRRRFYLTTLGHACLCSGSRTCIYTYTSYSPHDVRHILCCTHFEMKETTMHVFLNETI